MSYKEIAALSGGGIGVRFVTHCVNQMLLSTSNTLIGNTIGIDPTALYAIYIISILSSFPLTALRARMIDNTRSMKGKYRPYIISMGIPTVILGAAFIWMPYEGMSLFMKCVVVLLFNIGFQFFFNFYADAYDSLINVLSPNSIERTDVLSVKAVVENLSPSIITIVFPLLAKLITGENTLYDLKIFRILFPPMLLFGFLVSVVIYVNTEEKIVRAKTHFIKVRFMDALRSVAKNKYFWIISLAGWIGFLEVSVSNIMNWMYNYQDACSAGQFSVITAIAGNASFWPNLFAPFLIRKYGKKKILVITNVLNIGLIAMMLPVVRMTGAPNVIWLLLACGFVNSFVSALGHQLMPSINADIRDYQQYISGERIDGMFAAVGLIGNVITMFTSLVLPVIYERSGLNREVALSLGFDGSNVYDVLYDRSYFVSICTVLILAAIIGAALNVIPYFFFDFTEAKQKGVMKVLKIRAMFEDFGNNSATQEMIEETVEIIRESRAYHDKTPEDIKSAAKSERSRIKAENEQIESAQFVIDELNRFRTPDGKAELEYAKLIASSGLNGFIKANIPTMEDVKNMPNNTKEEKNRRKIIIGHIRDIRDAEKTAAKFFPDGIKEFDIAVLEKLFEDETKAEKELMTLLKEMKSSKENGRTDKVAEINMKIQNLRKKKTQIKSDIKKAEADYSNYRRAAKPYLDAVKTIKLAENYGRLDEIEAMCKA